MGAYDTLVFSDGKYVAQVKCWAVPECNSFKPGDTVPNIDGINTYSIALREGGFANVLANTLSGRTLKPLYPDVFDKWGNKFGPASSGLLGEDYLF